MPADQDRVLNVSGAIIAENNFTPTTFTLPSLNFENKVPITVFTRNGPAANMAVNFATNRIRIERKGNYEIHATVSFSGIANDRIAIAIYKSDGATQLGARTTRVLSATGDVGAVSITADAQLERNETIQLWVQNEININSIRIEDCRLGVRKI